MSLNCTEFESPSLQRLCQRNNDLTGDISNFFLIWASSLVFFMHAGFAMLSAGALRTKNTRNILISIVMDLTVCAFAWYFCGFAFAFGNDQGGFIGSSYFVGIDVGSTPTGVTAFYFWLFQWAFAATASTIVSGAVAERARFETYLIYSFYTSIWIYPVVVHWVWGGGFLTLGNGNGKSLMGSGVVDFAGSGVVHVVGGALGAIASKIMGPRIGRFDPETNEPFPIPGHSSPLATLGVFILWTGWLGFNPGSVINITGGNGSTASRAAVMTILSSAASALSALFLSHRINPDREFDINIALNGALAGLVSVTASCAFIEMWAAIAIGIMGGFIYLWASWFTLHKLKIDDPLDATAVHFFCGAYGVIAGAFFANPHLLVPFFPIPSSGVAEIPAGVFYGGNTYATLYPNGTLVAGGSTKGALVANAVVELVCIVSWVVGCITPLLLFLNRMEVLRVAPDVELVGLDVSHHGGQAYAGEDALVTWNYQDVKKSTNGSTSASRGGQKAGAQQSTEGGAGSGPSTIPVNPAVQEPTEAASKPFKSSPLIKVVLQSDGNNGMNIPLVLVRGDDDDDATTATAPTTIEANQVGQQAPNVRTGDSVSLA